MNYYNFYNENGIQASPTMFGVSNPTIEMLTEWGYSERINVPTEIEPLTNEIIKMRRQQAYKMRSDDLFLSWQKYLNTDQLEKATIAKASWLTEIDKIDIENPYIV